MKQQRLGSRSVNDGCLALIRFAATQREQTIPRALSQERASALADVELITAAKAYWGCWSASPNIHF